MKVAIIPWDDSVKNNSIYTTDNNEINWHIIFKQTFEDGGYEFNTIDVYKDVSDIDWFLFFTLDYYWIKKVIKAGKVTKMIYCSGEPAVVKPENSAKGYKKLLHLFAFIMTWNDDLVDGKRIFKRCIPYDFKREYGKLPFNEKKLLTNISGNKTSNHPHELYSERERVITYFEKNEPKNFDLYGTGWDIITHPSYLGMAESKSEVYHHYKFALSLENTSGVKGYITEKLLDCLIAGIVPIYQGASNINDFIPKDCYIDYSSFKSLEELRKFLIEMTESEYEKYLIASEKLLCTDIQKHFSGTLFAHQVIEIIEKGINIDINLDYDIKKHISRMATKKNIEKKWLQFKISMKKLLTNSKKGNR